MNYYQHNIGDFAALTQGLDLEAVGIVVRLFDRLMMTEKPIKTQWVSLAFPKETQEKAMCVLEGLFEQTADGWIYKPMLAQIENFQRNALKNRENGKKGGRPRKSAVTHSEPSGFLAETQTEANETLTINHKPLTINQEVDIDTRAKPARRSSSKLVKPEGVSDDVWDEYQAFKRKVSKGCTQRMVDALVRESGQAGITPEAAMIYQLEHGWTGFEAEWYLNQQQRTASKTKSNAPLQFDDAYYGDGSF